MCLLPDEFSIADDAVVAGLLASIHAFIQRSTSLLSQALTGGREGAFLDARINAAARLAAGCQHLAQADEALLAPCEVQRGALLGIRLSLLSWRPPS